MEWFENGEDTPSPGPRRARSACPPGTMATLSDTKYFTLSHLQPHPMIGCKSHSQLTTRTPLPGPPALLLCGILLYNQLLRC